MQDTRRGDKTVENGDSLKDAPSIRVFTVDWLSDLVIACLATGDNHVPLFHHGAASRAKPRFGASHARSASRRARRRQSMGACE
jgi:hypothetical protein